jgi:DNA-binding response OmpR family regulator
MMMTIMIVEDNENIKRTLKILLTSKGHVVYEHAAGTNILDDMEEEQPDLIFMDILLPKIDGITLCKIVKGNYLTSKIPLIFISAKSSEKDIKLAMDSGGDGYIVKPFGSQEILEIIKKHEKTMEVKNEDSNC